MRDCDVCHVTDDQPRHIHDAGHGATQIRHIGCCARTGCPSGTCTITDKEK